MRSDRAESSDARSWHFSKTMSLPAEDNDDSDGGHSLSENCLSQLIVPGTADSAQEDKLDSARRSNQAACLRLIGFVVSNPRKGSSSDGQYQ